MLTSLIYKSFQSGAFRKLVWKFTYEFLPRLNGSSEWQFMNYGYNPSSFELQDSSLIQEGFQWRSRAMYHCLARKGQLEGKSVLEVGFGRGGGLNHIHKTFSPSSSVGIDFSKSAVRLARRIHKGPQFEWGDATAMSLESDSFDVVVNVESCHAYSDLEAFFLEVHRVLKTDGQLLLVDLRTIENWESFYATLLSAGLEILDEEDITPNVVQAIEKDEADKSALINQRIPAFFRPLFKEFAGMVNSELHLSFKEGRRAYKRFVIRPIPA